MMKLLDISPTKWTSTMYLQSENGEFDCTFQCLYEQTSCEIVGFGTENQCFFGTFSTTNGVIESSESIKIFVDKLKIIEQYNNLVLPGSDWNKYGLWIRINASNSDECMGYCEFQDPMPYECTSAVFINTGQRCILGNFVTKDVSGLNETETMIDSAETYSGYINTERLIKDYIQITSSGNRWFEYVLESFDSQNLAYCGLKCNLNLDCEYFVLTGSTCFVCNFSKTDQLGTRSDIWTAYLKKGRENVNSRISLFEPNNRFQSGSWMAYVYGYFDNTNEDDCAAKCYLETNCHFYKQTSGDLCCLGRFDVSSSLSTYPSTTDIIMEIKAPFKYGTLKCLLITNCTANLPSGEGT